MPSEPGVGMGVPSVDTQQEADVASDAAMDSALDTIIGDDTFLSPEQEALSRPTEGLRERGTDGRFKPKEETSVEAEDGEPEAATVDDGANTDEYKTALRSLQRDKVPAKVLDNLTPAEVIEWGQDRAANHLDVDRINSRNAELEQAKDALKATEPEAQADAVQESLDEFKDYFGEEAAGPLKAYGEAILAKAQAGNESQNVVLQKLIDRMQAQESTEAREALSERWALSDTRWQTVEAHMAKDANEYPTVKAAVQAACRQLFADDNIDDLNSKLHTEHGKRDRGQPTTEHRGATPPAAKDMDALEDEGLDAILDGDDAEIAKSERRIAARQRRPAAPVVGRVGM